MPALCRASTPRFRHVASGRIICRHFVGHLVAMMQRSLVELFEDWHDFYLLVGTAAATLVGLMFVAASIGASVFSEEHKAAMRAFISPTVVHFSAALVLCVLAMIPSHTWLTFSALLAALSVAG